MLKIEIGGAKVSVPQGWDEVTLGEYEQWGLFRSDDETSYLQLIAAICKVEPKTLMNISVDEFGIIREALRFATETEVGASPQIEINGRVFSVSPSDKLTLGEWVDIDAIMASQSNTKISEMLAVVCRPPSETYDSDKVQSRYDMFRALTCDKALAPVNFFLLKKKRSDEILSLYSEVVDRAARFVQDTEHFVTNGDGIKLLPIWQRIRYTFLMKSLKKQLLKFSDSSSIASTRAVPKTISYGSKDK